jgi:ankyrin repeat protein
MDKATIRLFQAAYKGSVADVQVALDAGADVNASTPDPFRDTPLHIAVECGDFDIVNLLITKGADINAKDVFQETPLQLAKTCGNANIVELLEDAALKQQGHAGKITEGRKDKGPPQVGG